MSEGNRDNESVSRKLPQYIAAVSVCMGSVAAGSVIGWTSNITDKLKDGGLNNIEMNDATLGWVGSLVTLGAFAMCFPIGKLCDVFGRKRAMLGITVPFLIGWALIIFAANAMMVCIGRFLTGLSCGAFCVAAPLYTSEIADPSIRGVLGTYFQLFLTVGCLYGFITGYVLPIKVHTIVGAVLPIIFFIVFIFQPESPVYSLKKGQEQSAIDALKRLRGPKYDIDFELQEMKKYLAEEGENRITFLDALKLPATRKSAIIIFGQMFCQQLCGINAVLFYAASIFKSAGVNLPPEIPTILVGAFQVIATYGSSMLVERLGRKILLILSNGSTAVSIIILGIFISLIDRELVSESTLKTIGFIPVITAIFYIIMFAMGLGPIPWLMASELFPPEIKGTFCSIAGALSWGLAFIVTKFYLDLKNAIGGDSTFFIFGGCSILGTVFIIFMVFETKGKTLEEIQKILTS